MSGGGGERGSMEERRGEGRAGQEVGVNGMAGKLYRLKRKSQICN